MNPLSPDDTILAIDASTHRVGIILWQSQQCRAKDSWTSARGNPGQLVQAVEALRQRCHMDWNQLDAVLVGCGPGQYAGLRVSVTAANALQLPTKGRVVGIASPYAMLAAIRRSHPDAPAIVICGDARRNHVWIYHWSADKPETYPDLQCIPLESCRTLLLPANSIVASPDFARLHNRLPPPASARWIETDIFPEPEDMIRVALVTPALLGRPDLQYVHPPVGSAAQNA